MSINKGAFYQIIIINLFCVSLKNDNSNLANFAIVTIYLDKNIHN